MAEISKVLRLLTEVDHELLWAVVGQSTIGGTHMSLEVLRREAGLTLHGLADKSGIHFMKIHQIERGKIKAENITLRTAIKLSEALTCKPEDLLDNSSQKGGD